MYDRTEMLKIEISRRDAQVKNLKEEISQIEEERKLVEANVSLILNDCAVVFSYLLVIYIIVGVISAA